MKYYVIKSMIGNIECYWNSVLGTFSLFVRCSKFKTEGEAYDELVNKASFVEPSHVLEVTDKSKLLKND